MRRADAMELRPAPGGVPPADVDAQSSESFVQRLTALQSTLPVHADKPAESARATLRVLWNLAAGSRLSVPCAERLPLPVLHFDGLARLDALVAQRLSGVPLAHLSERQHFMGLDMLAGPQALIPRLETEQLGREALALMQSLRYPTVLDLCTGSGNLALALAHHAPQAHVLGGDVSAQAITLARRNAQHLGLSNRVAFREGDLFAPFQEPCFWGQIDVLVCNPPYISSAKVDTLPTEIQAHEPRVAFDGGPLGVKLLHRLLREAPLFLRPGGWLAIEVGRGQGQSVLQRLRAATAQTVFEAPISASDAHGDVRVVMARLAFP
jgi:release factor glutamine methyltransferase